MAPAKEKIVNGGIKRVRKAMEKGTNTLSEDMLSDPEGQ
jgi:hypothetical protein